ncbi:MAG: hypothetical protein IKT05_03570 [Fibrobacter sp.]|nr:hypothetical protein [Fibrobacter sp.]
MKKITTFLGCVGVVCLFWGCSDNDILTPNGPIAEDQAVSSAKESPVAASSSSLADAPATSSSSIVSSDPNLTPSSSSGKRDTVVVPRDSIVRQEIDSKASENLNYSSGVFCWSDECKTKYAGMTSNPDLQSSSSALSIDIGMSEEAKVPPVINGNTMTDARDNQQYKLETVEGTRWMAENLRYRTENGSFCEDKEGNDVCTKHKSVYYSYGVAQRVCPMGWRLPTADEVSVAAEKQPNDWWVIGGRFKLTEEGKVDAFGLDDGQGYIWIIQDDKNTSWRIKAYSGDAVEKDFQASEGPRAYNVRCVEGTDE